MQKTCGATDLYIIRNGALTGTRYRGVIMYAFVLPYAGAVGQDFIIIYDNARPHQARVVTEYLGREEIDSIEWSTRSPEIIPVEHV